MASGRKYVGAHNAPHNRKGTWLPGKDSYWKYITNQHLTINELIRAGVTVFDMDIYPIDYSIESGLKDKVNNNILRKLLTCFLSVFIGSWSEKPQKFYEFPKQDALLSHSMPILGWSYLSETLNKIPKTLNESIIISLNFGGGYSSNIPEWSIVNPEETPIDHMFEGGRFRKFIGWDDFDTNINEGYIYYTHKFFNPKGIQDEMHSINTLGGGILGQLSGDPVKCKELNENLVNIALAMSDSKKKVLSADFLTSIQVISILTAINP
jgi:hypothetical protein